MSFGFVDLFGYAAAVLTTGACLPQVVKSLRTHSLRDFSLGMLVVLNVGLACWIVYGAMHPDSTVLVANIVAMLLWGSLLVLKLRE